MSQGSWPADIAIPKSEDFVTVLSKVVPAGNYRIEAQVPMTAGLAELMQVECRVPGASNWTMVGSDRLPLNESMEITSAVRHAGGPIELGCHATAGLDSDTAYVHSATMLITKVTSVDAGGSN